MAVKFGKFTQKIQEKLQESKLAAKVADVGKAKAESIFNKITQKVQESETAHEASSPKVEEEEYTEEEKKTTALDVLKNINDFFSDNSITGILKSVLDTERGDISDIDGNNYITRDTARETKDSNDSFEDYCKSIGLDLNNSTNDKVTAAYTKYTQRIAEKNEFNELYDLMNSDSSLSSKLDDKVKIGGSLVNKFFEGSLSDFHDDIAETGAFKTDGESGGIFYNKKFDTKISAGLEQMKKLLDDPNVSDEIRTKADAIIQKYENQEKVAIGRRDGGSININSEIDERVTQAGTGDCYLLATLNSLQETENGKQIIKDSIIDNKDGSYTVKLNGVNMSYTFSTEDIEDAEKKLIDGTLGGGAVVGSGSDRYSNGDDDAMLIEMAIEKFRDGIYDGSIAVNEEWPDYASSTVSKEKHDKGLSSLNSGCMNQVLYLLSGVKTTTASKEDVSNTLDAIQKDIEENGGQYALYAGVTAKNGYTEDKNGKYYIKDGQYKEVTSSTPADEKRYSFTGAGSNDMYIKDPNGRCYKDENGRYRVVNDKTPANAERYSTIGSGGITLGDKSNYLKISNNSTGNHALSIVGITDDTVTIINPWDSDKIVEVPRDDFEGYMYQLQYAKLPAKSKTVA